MVHRGKRTTIAGICLLSLSLAAILLGSGCDRGDKVVYVDMSKRREVSYRQTTHAITYAYLPQYAHRVSYQRHRLLIQYLRKQTGLNIKQVFPNTFDEHIKMVGQGKIDISFSNPFIYVKLAHRFGARAIARIVEKSGRKNFRGQIICRSDNEDIRTIEDCRGKRWIAVDPSSAGGYLFALGYFLDHGIHKSDFTEISFAPGPGGKQEKVVLAVYAGRYDIGSIREGTLDVVADKIDLGEIRVLAETAWYPGWVYAVRREIPPEIAERIRRALIALNPERPEDRKILQAAHFLRIVPSSDVEFNSIRRLAKQLHMDLDH